MIEREQSPAGPPDESEQPLDLDQPVRGDATEATGKALTDEGAGGDD
jgi:hypothetical protein